MTTIVLNVSGRCPASLQPSLQGYCCECLFPSFAELFSAIPSAQLQGAWYVLSALGLYVVTPGTTDYVLGSPVFRHVRISRNAEPYANYYATSYEQQLTSSIKLTDSDSQHKYLDIIALGTGPGTVYVDQVTLNNKPVAGATVDDGSLQQDAVLRFIMRGEENSHEIEHHVQTVHMTTTSQLEEKLRIASNSANIEEDEEKMRKYAKLELDLLASANAIKELNARVAQLQKTGLCFIELCSKHPANLRKLFRHVHNQEAVEAPRSPQQCKFLPPLPPPQLLWTAPPCRSSRPWFPRISKTTTPWCAAS